MQVGTILANFPNDSGPIYQEIVKGRFPVEPFNTYSNLLFLVIVIYFSVLVYKNHKNQKFLIYVLPILFIGWLGGTIYHATRSNEIWLLMDWVPILVLCLSASLYFASKISKNKLYVALCIILVLILVFGIRFIPFQSHGETYRYIATALGLIFPIILHAWQTHFLFFKYVLFSVFSFSVAISFRTLDRYLEFSMGTHWLWHTFGAISVFFIMKYIFFDAKHQNSTFNSKE
ncbi:hypothetical protein [Zunongwangia sp.]|uniref:hypothetical protein n=1 Tax=Zunongwangia sp. TaxID=1965325 RepID=UPI003AA7FD52